MLVDSKEEDDVHLEIEKNEDDIISRADDGETCLS